MRVNLLAAVLGLTAFTTVARANTAALRQTLHVSRDTLAIEHATIIPMDRDTALVDQTILVAGDRIVWIGAASAARVPSAAQRIDGRGKFVIPGLADMHVHIEHKEDLARWVAAGVTTVRNMRGHPEHLAWRGEVTRGEIIGPTIFTTGPTCCHGLIPKDGFVRLRSVAQVDAAVRRQRQAGYDMIKVHSRLSPELYERLLVTARANRVPVVGHVIEEVGLARSLAAGQVSLEHAGFVGWNGDVDGDARAIAGARAWVGTIASDRSGQCAPIEARYRRSISALQRAGARLLAGSDASLDPLDAGTALQCELTTLMAAGLTAFEALAAATANASTFIRENLPAADWRFGTVTVGARADLVILSADPRQDLSALKRPAGTVLRGRWLPR